MNKYHIAAVILEKLFYAYLALVWSILIAICLLCQWYDVPAPVWPWGAQ